MPATVTTWPACSSASGLPDRVRHAPQRGIGWMQPDRRPGQIGQRRRRVDVVVVPVRAQDGVHPATADRGLDRVGVVRGVDDDHFLVVAHQPDVVVDVPGAAVQAERAGGDDLLDPGRHCELVTPSPG